METQTTKSESQATAVQSSKVFAAIELSQSKWVVAIHRTQVDKTSIAQMVGGDTEQLLAVLHRSAGNGKPSGRRFDLGRFDPRAKPFSSGSKARDKARARRQRETRLV